jgi:hypothetical protein
MCNLNFLKTPIMLCKPPHSISHFLLPVQSKTVHHRTTQVGDLCKAGCAIQVEYEWVKEKLVTLPEGCIEKLYSREEVDNGSFRRMMLLDPTKGNEPRHIERLLDLQQFDVEDQSAVGRDTG